MSSNSFIMDYTLPACQALNFQWNYHLETAHTNSKFSGAHIHPYYEMYVYLSGDVSFVANHRIYNLMPGDIIFTGPNTMHHAVINSECTHEHYCIFFYAADEKLTSLFSRLAKQTYLHFSGEDRTRLISLLHTIRKNLSSSESDTFRQTALIYELFSILQHAVGNEALPEYPYPLLDILSYIANHFPDLHELTPITEHFYISQSSLERLFKKHLKITPYQYIQAVKMESACRLLAGGASVTDAALTSGFSDVSHFIVCFRKRFDMTPREYAKKMQLKYEASK